MSHSNAHTQPKTHRISVKPCDGLILKVALSTIQQHESSFHIPPCNILEILLKDFLKDVTHNNHITRLRSRVFSLFKISINLAENGTLNIDKLRFNFNINLVGIWVRDDFKKKTDYFVTLIKRVGGYIAEFTTSWSLRNSDMSLGWVSV